MPTLHYHPRSTFSRRIRIAAIEKGLVFEERELDMQNKQHKSPEYRALNPYGRVPTLVDDGFVLYESTAILEYLEAKHPTPALLPGDPKARALAGMHMKLCDLELGTATGPIIFPRRFLPKEKWDVPAMEKSRKQVQRHLDILSTQLGGDEWLVGGAFSLVEVCYAPLVEFLPIMELTVPENVGAWAGRILGRESAQRTRPDR